MALAHSTTSARRVAVVCFVAFGLLCALTAPSSAREAASETVGSGSETAADGLRSERLDVAFDAGWEVPEIDHGDQPVGDEDVDAPALFDDHSGHAEHRAGAAAGTDAVGARVSFDSGPQMVVIDTGGRAGSFALRSRNGDKWSEWVEVHGSSDEAPDSLPGEEGSTASGATPAIGPIWVGPDVEAVEIVRVDGRRDQVTIEALRVDPAAPVAALVEGPQAAALPGMPSIQPRSAWATRGWAFGNDTCEDGPLYARNVDAMVIHHTVTTNSYAAADVPALIRGIYRTHVDINGWCDVAYNFMVDRFGRIWETRTGGVDRPVISGATKGFNTATTSVGVIGQFQAGASPSSVAPSQAIVDALAALGAWKLGLHGVDPLGTVFMKSRTSATTGLRFANGTWVHMPTILGHSDLGLSSCPGSRLYPSLAAIRSSIAATRDQAVPAAFPGRAPLDSGPAVLTVASNGGLRPAGAATMPAGAPTAVSGTQAIAVAASNGRGVQLLASGAVVGFGGTASPASNPAGSVAVVDVLVDPSGQQGWVLDINGRLHGFNGAADLTPTAGPLAGNAAAAALSADRVGYVVDSSGGLHAVGGAAAQAGGGPVSGQVAAVDVALRSGGESGWVLDVTGTLHPFGGAPGWQSALAGRGGAVAAMVDGTDTGGWVLDSQGQLFSFGRARHVQPISTTVGSATVTDGTLWWHLPTDLAETEDGAYTAAVFELFLGREASLAEIDRWAWEIDYLSRAQVVEGFVRSDAWAGAVVGEIYQDVLGRAPDAGGRAYWVGRLADGLRTQDLGAEFYASPEYVAAAGSDAAYITALYRALLHREPDEAGISFWTSQMAGGVPPISITRGFYQSPESRRDRVQRLYGVVLGRSPEAEGLTYWAERLNVQDDDIALALNLAVSDEYFERVTGK